VAVQSATVGPALAPVVSSVWVKEQQVNLDDGKILNYQVNMLVTFVLE